MTPPAVSMPGSQNTTPRKSTRGRWEWLRRYGRPLAHYTDKNSISRTSAAALLGEQLRGEKARSHFGRALGELGLEWIAAHSPRKDRSSHRSKRCRTAWYLYREAAVLFTNPDAFPASATPK